MKWVAIFCKVFSTQVVAQKSTMRQFYSSCLTDIDSNETVIYAVGAREGRRKNGYSDRIPR